MFEKYSCSASSSAVNIVSLFNINYFSVCVAASHCGLVCIRLTTNDVEQLFMCLLVIYTSFVKYLFKSFAHFLKLSFSSY